MERRGTEDQRKDCQEVGKAWHCYSMHEWLFMPPSNTLAPAHGFSTGHEKTQRPPNAGVEENAMQ